uniref:RRM domain-containing protein n=1 Tax=Marmota marmota marmota TaxID=9994 RepID=A0A8C5YUY8_MARMA
EGAAAAEELLFKLFHQDGPVIKVKIPKDKDGKPKQFAFVNFKHEVSVPYAMNLLNGIKLFGRPIKIQFRSGSSHASQVVSMSYSQHHVGNSSPTSTSPSRYERTVDNVTASAQVIQRSFSSPENYQRQAVMNSVLRQMSYGGKFGSSHVDQSGFNHQFSHIIILSTSLQAPIPPPPQNIYIYTSNNKNWQGCEERVHSYIAVRTANWCNHSGRQYGDSSENLEWNYHLTQLSYLSATPSN